MVPAQPWECGTEPKAATCPNLSDLDKAVVSDHIPPCPPCFPFRPLPRPVPGTLPPRPHRRLSPHVST